jgi:hypothetical protein
MKAGQVQKQVKFINQDCMRQDAAKELVMGLASLHLEVDPNEH